LIREEWGGGGLNNSWKRTGTLGRDLFRGGGEERRGKVRVRNSAAGGNGLPDQGEGGNCMDE